MSTEIAAERGSLAKATAATRIDALDGVRGLAIVFVLIGHYLPNHAVHGFAATLLYPFGTGGVMLFFFLSGFLIERNLSRGPPLALYALRRLCRIMPAYWVSLVVLLAVQFLGNGRITSDLREFVINALLVQDVLRAPLMNGVFWTLLVETKFYALAPLVTRLGAPAIVIAPYIAIALNAMIAIRRGGEASNLLNFMTHCLVGMNFSLWFRGGLSTNALVALVVTAAIAVATMLPSTPYALAAFLLLNAAILGAALMCGLKSAPLAFAGRVSYSWYLYHSGIGYPLMAWLEAPAIGLHPVLSVAIGAAVTLLVSWISLRLIEEPCIELGRRFEQRWKLRFTGKTAPKVAAE